MTNGKFRISFEITDNWSVEGFRNFIKLLLSNDTVYEVFLISNDDESALVAKIGELLNLDSDHVIITNFADDKLQAIITHNIDIHLDNLQSFVMSVDNFTSNTHGILITKNLNKFYLQPDYILVFDRIIKEIQNESI
jgi:hypothetical protein